ncbi:MAG: tRNA lysidine(34) synthetase TilS [Myxococcota bacterium]
MLVEHVDRAVTELGLEGRRLMVAVSGGIDSSVLLRALVELAPARRLSLAVAHVQHELRGDESTEDERTVREWARELGLPWECERADPHPFRASRSNRDRPTLQEAAREARYGALLQMAARWEADHIATAHNLDDQAETVLMRILRGTGPKGLGGIERQSRDGVLVRPLLEVSRAAIEEFARARKIPWREDSSNAKDAYTRNRLRHHWIPALRDEFNPQLLRTMGRLAEALQEDERWIEEMVDEATRKMSSMRRTATREDLVWVSEGWTELPDALAMRVVRRGLHDLGRGRDVTRVHLDRVLAFLRNPDVETGRRIELPGGHEVVRTATGYRLRIGQRAGSSSC